MAPDSLPLADMQVFVQVVQQRSFARAAGVLQLTTSAVSRSVHRLEQKLGVKLLQRSTRALSLTEVGSEVFAQCLHMLESAEHAVSLAAAHRQQPQGTLRISAPAMLGELWLAPRLPAFCAQWPEVHVQVDITDALADLHADGIDLAIRISTVEALAPGLVAQPLFPVRYLIVAHPDYLARSAAITQPQDLPQHPCMSLGYGAFQNLVDMQHIATGENQRICLHTPLTLSSSLALLQALTAGRTGLGLMVDFVAQPAISRGELVQVLPDWSLLGNYAPRTAYAVFAPGPHIPPKLRAMLDYLQGQRSKHAE